MLSLGSSVFGRVHPLLLLSCSAPASHHVPGGAADAGWLFPTLLRCAHHPLGSPRGAPAHPASLSAPAAG